jgi:glucan phosphoethanolaminetransferase (alkaline phosphatase superfamily)
MLSDLIYLCLLFHKIATHFVFFFSFLLELLKRKVMMMMSTTTTTTTMKMLLLILLLILLLLLLLLLLMMIMIMRQLLKLLSVIRQPVSENGCEVDKVYLPLNTIILRNICGAKGGGF